MVPYANAFLRQGSDNLLIALRSMSRYVPLAGKFISVRFYSQRFTLSLAGSLMRDLDLEGRRMAPIITAPRYSKELHVISDLEHHHCAVVH